MDAPTKRRGRPKDEQLTARRRDEILDVAAHVFANRGYRNTDVQVVADEIGVGKGTVYRYFPTKQELFLAAVDRAMHRLTAYIDASTTATDPLAQVEQAIRAHLRFSEANPEIVELLIQERAEFKDRPKPTYFEHRDASADKWQALHRRLVETGRMREASFDAISDVIGDLMYSTMFTNYFARRQRPAEQRANEIVELLLVGLLTDGERVKRLSMPFNESAGAVAARTGESRGTQG